MALNLARRIGLIACTLETFKEFEISFMRNKFEKYLPLNRRYVDIVEIKTYVEFFIVKENASICRDPD
jgi:predicted nucleic acid-binding protein